MCCEKCHIDAKPWDLRVTNNPKFLRVCYDCYPEIEMEWAKADLLKHRNFIQTQELECLKHNDDSSKWLAWLKQEEKPKIEYLKKLMAEVNEHFSEH